MTRPVKLAHRRRWEVTVRSIALAAGLPRRRVREHVNMGKVRPWDTASLCAYVAGQRAISEARVSEAVGTLADIQRQQDEATP